MLYCVETDQFFVCGRVVIGRYKSEHFFHEILEVTYRVLVVGRCSLQATVANVSPK